MAFINLVFEMFPSRERLYFPPSSSSISIFIFFFPELKLIDFFHLLKCFDDFIVVTQNLANQYVSFFLSTTFVVAVYARIRITHLIKTDYCRRNRYRKNHGMLTTWNAGYVLSNKQQRLCRWREGWEPVQLLFI